MCRQRHEVALEDAADEQLGQRVRPASTRPARRSGLSSAGPNRVAVVSRSCRNSRAPGLVERLGEQLVRSSARSRPCRAASATKASCSSRARCGPHDVVEEQVVDVVGGEPGQLEAGPVDDRPGGAGRPRSRRGRSWRTSLLERWVQRYGGTGYRLGHPACAARGRPGCRAGRRRRTSDERQPHDVPACLAGVARVADEQASEKTNATTATMTSRTNRGVWTAPVVEEAPLHLRQRGERVRDGRGDARS